MATFIQEGVYLDHTPSGAVAQGDVIAIGDDLFGVALTAIAATVKGALAVSGIFEFDSDDDTIAVGALCFWDSAAAEVTDTAVDNKYIGRAISASADGKVRVALNATNIGAFTAIVPGTSPDATQETFAALTAEDPTCDAADPTITAVDPDAITAADPTVVDPTTTGIDGETWESADSVVKAAIEANNTAIKAVEAELEMLIDNVTSIHTQLKAAIADLATLRDSDKAIIDDVQAIETSLEAGIDDLGTLRTAVNAGKFDLAAVVTQLEAASVLE